MLLSELSLSVSSGSLESEVVQCYNKLRKLELTLMDQVINLTLNEGEFHKEAIVSLQKRISMIQVTLKLIKQMLACETKFKTSVFFFFFEADFIQLVVLNLSHLNYIKLCLFLTSNKR